MYFEVYCDESCPEILWDKNAHKYLVLGSLWLPGSDRIKLKESLNSLKQKHNYNYEIKWNKVSPKTFPFFKDLIKYFFDTDYLRFRAITVKSEDIDLVQFHEGDAELSFYKFYYQMLNKWILDFNEYSIFLDHKRNKENNRIKVLKDVLSNASLSSAIKIVQALPSNQSLGIQLCDVLTGAVNAKFNASVSSKAKLGIISEIEFSQGKILEPTPKFEEKFNVFNIRLRGGW